MSEKLPRRWFAFRLRTLFLLVAALAVPFGCFSWLHRVSIYGEVADDKTGEPIADVYVIASIWTSLFCNPFDTNPHKFAVHTDDTGHFSFRGRMPFAIGRIDVEASSPDDQYAASGTGNGWFVAGSGHYTLRVRPFSQLDGRPHGSQPWVHRDAFYGMWGGDTTWLPSSNAVFPLDSKSSRYFIKPFNLRSEDPSF